MSAKGQIVDHIQDRTIEIQVGQNISLNLDPFSEIGVLDSLDHDLLRVAAFVYAADLAVKRSEREQHLRSISVRIPVANYQAFERVRSLIEQALTTLTVDNWTIEFEALSNSTPTSNRVWPEKQNSTLLFSGGLDSFAGSVDLLSSQAAVTLVSHVTHNWPVKNAQSNLADAVRTHTGKSVRHLQISVFGRNLGEFTFPSDDDREDTQRARSFLFTSLAAVGARLDGSKRIVVMAENGQFAIHLPLSEARVGSFSTHTAHPKFLVEMQMILRSLFGCGDIEVVNPFVHRTKAEVVKLIPPALRSQIKDSSSCWRASRLSKHSHCGECVPCLCRRIALEFNGIKIPEYERNLLGETIGKLKPDDLGKRNLVDLCQFIGLFSGPGRIDSDQELCFKFPELFDPNLNAVQVIRMYRRFADEAFAVLNKYPKVRGLLQ